MLNTLHKEIKDDGDWVVYEDLKDFKDQFCSWVDASIEEGLSDDSKVLSLKKDSYVVAKCCEMFFVEMNEQSVNNAL